MLKTIEIISNGLNPIKVKSSAIDNEMLDILTELSKQAGLKINFKSRLSVNVVHLKSQEILNIKNLEGLSGSKLNAFALFMHTGLKDHEFELSKIYELIDLYENNFKQFKATCREFVENKKLNYLYHNFAEVEKRIVLFINSLYQLFTIGIFRVSPSISNKDMAIKYIEFINVFEFRDSE